MSVNSKHLHDVPNLGQKKIELFHVRLGDQELITIEQEDNNPDYINAVQVSLDGLDALLSALVDVKRVYRPDSPPGEDSNQRSFFSS